jgi:dihydrodipicolinate synthase/N-acetylneuraminate lyase
MAYKKAHQLQSNEKSTHEKRAEAGRKGAASRLAHSTPQERAEIARKAAAARAEHARERHKGTET